MRAELRAAALEGGERGFGQYGGPKLGEPAKIGLKKIQVEEKLCNGRNGGTAQMPNRKEVGATQS